MFDTSDYVSIARLPGGRAMVVVRRIKEQAAALKIAALVAACEQAEARCKTRAQLEARLVAERDAGQRREEGGELDQLLDSACTAIYRACLSAEEGKLAAPAKAAHAKRLLQACFPAGLAAVTRVSYEDEFEQLTRIAGELGKQEIKDALAALALEEEAAILLTNLDAYEQAIKHRSGTSAKQVNAARREAHEALCLIVAHIVVAYPDAAQQERAQLLAPLLEQIAVVREQRRADRPRTDLDPSSGDERPIDPVLVER